MRTRLIMIVGSALLATACSTTSADSDGAAAETAINGARPKTAQSRTALPRNSAVTIPAGTALTLSLTSAVASYTSRVEDAVSARLTQAVSVGGRDVLPAGSTVSGQVTSADASARVKGRAEVAFRFNTLTTGGQRYDIETVAISRIASATKGEDATKIGIGAGAGAIIGGLVGGKSGAAKGAVVGGGAGTGVVLATKGREIRLSPGEDVTTTLTAPLTVRVRN
jgi:hypothetical protein